jgi:heat shock protein HtpX
VTPEDIPRRNRIRIVGVALMSVVTYWIAVCAAAVATALTIFGWLFMEFGDIPNDADLVGFAALIGVIVLVLVAVAVVIGSLIAAIRLPLERRRLERRVLEETGARPARPEEYERVRNLVEGLSIAAGVPVPPFAIIDEAAPNAFGVGTNPSHTLIGVTTGLLATMNRDELEAILAYEVSRIRSHDVALASWTVALTGSAISTLSAEGLVRSLGYVPRRFAYWLQAWAMRDQGRLRDQYALSFTRHPEALVSALEKLAADPQQIGRVSRATAPLWVEFPDRVLGDSKLRSDRRLRSSLLLAERIGALRARAAV